MPPGLNVVEKTTQHDQWSRRLLTESWGSVEVISRGVVHDASLLPGFVCLLDGEPAGLATYRIDGEECDVVTLNALTEGRGVATALLDKVRGTGRDARCRRVWLVTTNDNLHALRFYQRRGFQLVAVHRRRSRRRGS